MPHLAGGRGNLAGMLLHYLERGAMEPSRGSIFTEVLHPSEKRELSLKAKLKASFSLLII